MNSREMSKIISSMTNNEIVRFADDYGQTITIFRGLGDYYDLSATSKDGCLLTSTFFNKYEEDKDSIKLYWDAHIVGMIYSERF